MNIINQFYKPMILLFVVAIAYSLLSFADGSQNVANQNTGLGQNLTNLIEQRFTRSYTIPGGGTASDLYPSINVIYESPRMLVLFGYILTGESLDNADLWEATDLLQNEHGFDLTDIIKEGEGSKGNPGRVYLIMEKSSGVRGYNK
jgi:hypothetical protein